jgi:hypothetical protein
MDRLQLTLEDADFKKISFKQSNTNTLKKSSMTKKSPHSHKER